MPPFSSTDNRHHSGTIGSLGDFKGFDLSKYKGINKRLALRDCTEPELGKHILDWAIKPYHRNAQLF